MPGFHWQCVWCSLKCSHFASPSYKAAGDSHVKRHSTLQSLKIFSDGFNVSALMLLLKTCFFSNHDYLQRYCEDNVVCLKCSEFL